ncbi:GDSL esterase/lipase EXL3-like [Rosa sericea]
MAFLSPKILPSSSSVRVSVIILFILLSHNVAARTLPKNGTTPAVFAFGDSILDTGNNDYIISMSKSNFPPYGRDFMGGMPTGRFSNGRVPSDFIAEELGVKKMLPAYLDPNLQLQDLLTGVCFASGGSGYDPLTSKLQSGFSLSDQLDFFKEYKRRITAAVGEERTATIISKSVYVVSVGSNDIANTYFSTPLRSSHYDIPAYTDLLLESAINFVQELYALGARVIGVFNFPPLGCLPSERTLHGGIVRACYEAENQAAIFFNSNLSPQIDSLNKRLPEADVIYLDIYTPLLSMIQNPAQYGFEVVDKGCCGTGYIEAGPLCNKDSPGTCNDPSKYLFWDAYHPTETGYRFLTSMVSEQSL